MIISRDSIKNLGDYITYHHIEHGQLCECLLEKVAKDRAFKMNVKKASIHLQSIDSFAVVGFRRSKKSIFVEFYSSTYIMDKRIIKAYKATNDLIINRVNIEAVRDVNDELMNYILQSDLLIKNGPLEK